MRQVVEIVILDSDEAYRQEYYNVFIKGGSFYLRGIQVLFDEKSFNHIFYESDGKNSKGKFSCRRAKKMHFITAILNEKVNIEITFEESSGNIAIFCKDLDCVMYLRNRVGTKKLQIGSFFDFGKEHTKNYERQRKKCRPISEEELKGLVK